MAIEIKRQILAASNSKLVRNLEEMASALSEFEADIQKSFACKVESSFRRVTFTFNEKVTPTELNEKLSSRMHLGTGRVTGGKVVWEGSLFKSVFEHNNGSPTLTVSVSNELIA